MAKKKKARKAKSPRKASTKDDGVFIGIKMSRAEKAKLKKLALKHTGGNMSELVRSRLLKGKK